MTESYKIAAYTRISVDTELDRDNTSIENQKAIIADYCRLHFPTSTVDYFEDRDHSGYTFEQRPGYMALRPLLLSRQYDILIIKDLSRFSRRTGRGLVEFEDLAEKGLRIIAIGDGVDHPTRGDDWLKIKMYFFINEMPVTDASNKVKAVVANRQEKGEWICSVPYGYVFTNTKKGLFEVDEPAAEVVREIFRLYLEGWGYQKIAKHLTDEHIPTPRMREKMRKEAAGDEYRAKVRETWSIVTISEILDNDFYIGTLRQHKFKRQKINGRDLPLDESEHLVFENNHPPIVDYRTFAAVKEQMKQRSVSNYRGVKKYDNVYSGFLFCGDCGSPMFAMSRKDLAPAYTCGTYHVRGRSGCTSHHIRCDRLDAVLKDYLRTVRDNSVHMLALLEESIRNEDTSTRDSGETVLELEQLLDSEREELKGLMRQKTRDLLRAGDRAAIIEQTYDSLIEESGARIEGLKNQIQMISDSRNIAIRVNRVAKTVMDIFDDILEKDKLDKNDIGFLVDRILVYEDKIEIRLKSDIDELLRTGTISGIGDADGEDAANFNQGTENIEKTLNQSSKNHGDKVFRVRIISGGDPLEIYTDREGEVIFKKYSPLSELVDFAGQYAESLYKTCNFPVAVCDRDSVVAAAGVSKKEFLDKKISRGTDLLIEGRNLYSAQNGSDSERIPLTEDERSGMYLVCAMPIFTEGDVIGCVAAISPDETFRARTEKGELETEIKLIRTAAAFLGRQLEG